MTAVRMVGLIVLVFVVSLPATFFMHAEPLAWFSSNAKEAGEAPQEQDDAVVDILCIKAMKELSEGNHAKAIALYTKAIERDPKLGFVYLARGDAFALQGDLDRATQDYNRAAQLDPSDTGARERLALIKLEKAAK